ncbi:hypothetical protein ACP70R_048397 [Stipagrostis hirtigluma subsp. patula]
MTPAMAWKQAVPLLLVLALPVGLMVLAVDTSVPYTTTSGEGSVVGATIPIAPQAVVACTSAAWGGFTSVECDDSDAAHSQETSGSGSVADLPVPIAVAVSATAAAWGGESSAVGRDFNWDKEGTNPEAGRH